MIRSEYLRFLETLNTATIPIPPDVNKLATLVLSNIEQLIPLGTHNSQRLKYVVNLAQINWNSLSTEIVSISENMAEHNYPITQLKSITVGPFRGFSKAEYFDLSSRLILIYGPNGTGKSSFCEAIEYSLLGSVAEAENKRFRDQQAYFKNASVNRFVAPELIGLNGLGEEFPIVAKDELYRFCFIEKNRIDNFSRIAAQTPAKQTELISTLFGLDLFNDFVRKFPAEIDPKYIDLIGKKSELLKQKRQTHEGARQLIELNSTELQQINTDEQALANEYREGLNFNKMFIELNGCAEDPGLISRMESEIQQPLLTKTGLNLNALTELGQKIYSDQTELNAIRQDLSSASQKVSYKNLYDAVTQLQPSTPSNCPACKTPLNQVTVNPFFHANEELKNLQHLAEQQQALQKLELQVNQSFISLTHIVNICCSRITPNILSQYLVPSNVPANIEWWNSLHQPKPDNSTAWQYLQSQVQQLEETDKTIEQAVQIRRTKQEKLECLRKFLHKVTVLQTRRNTAQQTLSNAQLTITNFDTENAQLLNETQAEVATVERNKAIANSYKSLVTLLNTYKNKLPTKLLADLDEQVVTLYNSFNRNDSRSELLASVKLPLVQHQRLEISFQDKPNQFFDALHILSEGHIRCIGLAILLAKNLKENCPLLIFDDPVNAIDDEHKESIRLTLFQDDYFADKQIILTCHGEEFFKDIHNLLPAQIAAQSQSLAFLPRLDEPHIQVDFNCTPRNYIIAARKHFKQNEVRQALSQSRKAMESLTKGKIWRYVNKYGDGNLSIKLRAATAPIELRNLAEQLKVKIDKGDFADPHKNLVFEPLNMLIGLNGNSREWRYLNKGTHEENDRAEFDRNTVATMISALEMIDQAIEAT
jgi:DNA sulfur modification protein DndD